MSNDYSAGAKAANELGQAVIQILVVMEGLIEENKRLRAEAEESRTGVYYSGDPKWGNERRDDGEAP